MVPVGSTQLYLEAMDQPYLVLAYYHFVPLQDPHGEVLEHKRFFESRDATCRIYISEEGINGQMSAAREDAQAYMDWMHGRPQFGGMEFKIHGWHEQVFPKLTIKYRKRLVAFDKAVDLEKRGKHLSPAEWKRMLESDEKPILLDIRNEYEWKLGHFKGALLPPCETFRDFDQYAENLKQKADPHHTPIMMYCTGGIRCELYSAVLKERGFEKVYQLQGGIINYGLKQGTEHWLGKLFVFDDRLSIPITDAETPVIGRCHHCNTTTESYYNCANMDCNHLFLCCPDCLLQFAGCCKEECRNAPRVRPHHEQNAHKPFRKWYKYFPKKEKCEVL